MNQSPSQTKTPKSKKSQQQHAQSAHNSDLQQAEPQTLERYLQIPPSPNNNQPPRGADVSLPTIFRKHQYGGKEFTEIYDLRTGLRTTRSKDPIKYTISGLNEVVRIGSFLVNNSEPAYKKTEWKQLYRSDKNCECKKSECLKNYCPCRQKGAVCTSDCHCHNCKNKAKTEVYFQLDERTQVRNRSREKGVKGLEERQCTKGLQQNDLGLTNVCACKKSKNCAKLYCGCCRLGINCSNLCACSNCKN